MLQGLFVYEGTGKVDWAQVANAGYCYAWIKATEGVDHTDGLWRENVDGARANGLSVGHLHYLDAGATAAPPGFQFDHFAAVVGDLEEGERLIVDAEDGYMYLFVDAEVWCLRAAIRYGFRPMIYTRRSLIDSYMPTDTELDQCGLSLADWDGALGPPPHPWPVIADWQWSCNGSVPGVDGAVCLHRFNGGPSQLVRYGRPR